MMAPQPPPGSADADLRPPEVRLDVRVGSGRAVGYDLTRGEFLVGGADGCDVRLPGSHLPAVIAQFGRTTDGVFVRRLAPAFPILLNGKPLGGSDPVAVNSADRVAIGSADIVVSVNGRGHIRPTFHEYPAKTNAVTHPSPGLRPPSPSRGEGDSARLALDKYRDELAQQAKELEADRVAWYRRRQEIEQEVRQLQESVTAGSRLADREAWLAKREQETAAREEELARVREELAEIRQTLFAQYRERRDQLEQMQQVVRGATDTFQERQSAEQAELQRRRAELDAEAGRLQEYVSAEVERRAATLEMDFRRRRMELEAHHDARLRELEAEAATRRLRFEDELQHFEPRLADLHSQREQLNAAARELDTQRQQLVGMRQEIARERQAVEAERKWNDERRAEAEGLQAAQDAELLRQRELLDQDRQELEVERQKHAADLLRLDRWQAAVEERQLALDHRAADIDARVQQLTRDAIELEDHIRRTDAEQERQAREAERLAEVKREQEQRAAQLSERSAQLEAQQASLAVLRARLDRHEDDLHREAAALTADRVRIAAAQRELDERLRDAEHLRASLGSFHTTNAEAERAVAEQRRVLELAQDEIRQQREQLSAEQERLSQLEHDLDRRSADIAEQTAVLKAKTAQVIDLQQRLEADRSAVQSRESVLTDADHARVSFQEQLRKRGEELSARGKELDLAAGKLADDRLAVERLRAELAADREKAEQAVAAARQHLLDREAELERHGQLLADREAALERQVARLRETGKSVAAGRKELFTARQQWQTEQATLVERTLAAQKELDRFRTDALTEVERLKSQAPTLEDQAGGTLQRLAAAREVLRGQLAELHGYASQTRDTLEGLRNDLRVETERLRYRETELERARGEHRLAVSEFRAQILDWQAKVNELKGAMARSETRIDQKQAELEAAAKKSDSTAIELARRMEQLRLDQETLADRRIQVERHLTDMREWYRKKLRDLAAEKQASPAPLPRLAEASVDEPDLEPGDRQLGELLRSLELIDPATLDTLWAEARRQRRTLRQVLLASGAVTLYQLALIEAGNLDALMIGRFRVVDRVRVTPREAVYRVFDPQAGGVRVLRVLGDSEMHDATHPDEYRQRFTAAAGLHHPHLTVTHEVLEVNGRPAAVQEVVSGLPGSEWPAACATPCVWVKLLTDAASAVDAAHRGGLTHGRLTTDSFVLTPAGVLKVIGFGDPPWLTSGMPPAFEPTAAADLRALGQAAYLWSTAGGKKKLKGVRGGFPEPLLAVIRRLETDPENPMGDTAAGVEPYRSAAELHADLLKLAAKYPLPADVWDEMVRAAGGGGEAAAKKAG